MKIELTRGDFRPEFLENLTTIADSAQSSLSCSRIVIENTEGGRIKSRCKYHFLQLVACLFTRVISCLFSRGYRRANSNTVQWFVDTYGQGRMQRISQKYLPDLFHVNQDAGVPLTKRDVQVIHAALSVVTREDMEEIFNQLKASERISYLTDEKATQLAAQYASLEFDQLSAQNLELLYAIANPFLALGERARHAIFLGTPPSYLSVSYDRGETARGILELANEKLYLDTTNTTEEPSLEDVRFIKWIAGWYNPDGMVIKFADGGFRFLEDRVGRGGQYKLFFPTMGIDSGSEDRPHILCQLPTQAMGTAPHADLSIQEDTAKEIGWRGCCLTHHATREILNRHEGMWKHIGYSLGGTGAANDLLCDLAGRPEHRKFKEVVVVSNPGVTNETAAALIALTDCLPESRSLKIHLVHNFLDLASSLGDKHPGYLLDPRKVEVIHDMWSPPGGFKGQDPSARPVRTQNFFSSLIGLYKSLMRGPHHSVPDQRTHQKRRLTNQDPMQLRVLNAYILENNHLGYQIDTGLCSVGHKGKVIKFLQNCYSEDTTALIHRVDLSRDGQVQLGPKPYRFPSGAEEQYFALVESTRAQPAS